MKIVKSSDFDENTNADMELRDSQVTKYETLKKFKMADGRQYKNRFGHNSAAECPISVKFCVREQFFTEFGNGTDNRPSAERILDI